MTPKQFIIEAISCAMKNAHDQGMGDHDHEYAVGTVVIEIMYGDGDVILKGKPFDGLAWEAYTRADLRPHLLEAIALFMNTMTDFGVLKEGAS